MHVIIFLHKRAYLLQNGLEHRDRRWLFRGLILVLLQRLKQIREGGTS